MCQGHATGSAVDYCHNEFHLDPTLTTLSSTPRNGVDFIKKKYIKKTIIVFVVDAGT